MKNRIRSAFVAGLSLVLLLPLAAQANLVSNGDFADAAKFDNTGKTFDTAEASTYNTWLAGPNWSRDDAGFALRDSDDAGILIQGFSLPSTSCVGPGWTVKVSFRYKSETGSGSFQMYGFTSGTWNSADGTVTGSPTLLQDVGTFNSTDPGDQNDWETFSGSFLLNSSFAALAVGFDLDAVDDVVVDVVAPVSLKFVPRTLNLKSSGNYVNVFISNPPFCYTLKDIDPDSVRLVYNDAELAPKFINRNGNKFMVKFSRQELIEALAGTTGLVTLKVTGTFLRDGLAFEGKTTVEVINPGNGPKNAKKTNATKAGQGIRL